MDISVDKCLALCQTLATSGQKFSLTLSIGKDKFSFNNKELSTSSCSKKKSPSQMRREQRRKEERALKNAAATAAESTEKVVEASVSSLDMQCSQCDLCFKAEQDLKIHMEDMHTISTIPTPEKERVPDQIGDLRVTPVHGKGRVEVASPPSPPPPALGGTSAPATSYISPVGVTDEFGQETWTCCGMTFINWYGIDQHKKYNHAAFYNPDDRLLL